jgi:hypothetical protein
VSLSPPATASDQAISLRFPERPVDKRADQILPKAFGVRRKLDADRAGQLSSSAIA